MVPFTDVSAQLIVPKKGKFEFIYSNFYMFDFFEFCSGVAT